jgi:hypothetical protein
MKVTENNIKKECNNCAHNISLICDIDSRLAKKTCTFWVLKPSLRRTQERAFRINKKALDD